MMRKLRERVNTAFYIRYNYAYVIVNSEDGRNMILYKQKRGSLWMNSFAEAESWFRIQQENDRENLTTLRGLTGSGYL